MGNPALYHPFEPAVRYNTEAHVRPPCRVCGCERVQNPNHFKPEEAKTVSDKDFTVTAETVRQILEANAVEQKQNPIELYALYGCVAVEHHFEDRVDLFTFDLAYRIAATTPALEEALGVDPVATVRQIISDLEVHTSHLAATSTWITHWKNVGMQYGPADLNNPYVPEGVTA